jgi:cobalamin biosynthesis Mg chelatase CobN
VREDSSTDGKGAAKEKQKREAKPKKSAAPKTGKGEKGSQKETEAKNKSPPKSSPSNGKQASKATVIKDSESEVDSSDNSETTDGDMIVEKVSAKKVKETKKSKRGMRLFICISYLFLYLFILLLIVCYVIFIFLRIQSYFQMKKLARHLSKRVRSRKRPKSKMRKYVSESSLIQLFIF